MLSALTLTLNTGWDMKNHRFLTVGSDEYISFACMKRSAIDDLSPAIRSAIMNSARWKKEEEVNLEMTNCLGLLVSKDLGLDGFLVLNIGYDDSYKSCKSWVP
jgi:hypothetical protein